MEFIAEIRRRHFVDGESISAIAHSLKKSRPTVRKALRMLSEPLYQRTDQPLPKLGPFKEHLADWLEVESRLPKRQRRTAQRLFEGLQAARILGAIAPSTKLRTGVEIVVQDLGFGVILPTAS